MFSENLSTTLEKIKGALSEKGLLIFACVSLCLVVFWSIIALIVQGKFSKRCRSIEKFIEANNLGEKDVKALEGRAKVVSSGFYNGYLKFKKAESGKASDFITKKESLDDKANYNFLYNSKPVLRFFIIFTTIIYFVLNLILKTGENSLTGTVLGESIIYPLIYLFFAFLVYVIYLAISHHIYVVSEEAFNALLNLMDDNMSKTPVQKPVEVAYVPVQQVQVVEEKKEPEEPVAKEEPQTVELEKEPEKEPESAVEESAKDENLDEEENFEEESDVLYEVGDDVLDSDSERDIENFIGSIVENNTDEQEEQLEEVEEEQVEEPTAEKPVENKEQEPLEELNGAFVDNDEFLSLLSGEDNQPEQAEEQPAESTEQEQQFDTFVDNDDFMSLLFGEVANEPEPPVEEPTEEVAEESVVEEQSVVEESPAEETSVEEPQVAEELAAEETSVEEPQVAEELAEEETKVEEVPVEETPVEETPVEEEVPVEEVEEVEEFAPFTFIDVDGNGENLPPQIQSQVNYESSADEEEEIIVERSPLEVIDDHLLAANRKPKPEVPAKVEEVKEEVVEEPPVEEEAPVEEEKPAEPEPKKTEDEEIADLVGQFKNLQFESEDNYVPEKVIELDEDEEDEEETETLDEESNEETDEVDFEDEGEEDELDYAEDELDFEDEDLEETEEVYEDDYEEDEALDSDVDEEETEDYEEDLSDYDESEESDLFDDIMVNDENIVEEPETPAFAENQANMQQVYYDPNQYGYYPQIVGYDQNGYPIYQNAGYAPMYPDPYNYANQEVQTPESQDVLNENDNLEDYYEETLEDDLDELEIEELDEPVEESVEEPVQSEEPKVESAPKKRGRTKKTQGTHQRRKSESKVEEDDDQKQKNGRGRPKTKVYDGPFEIHNDEEFNEVLEDATKLMRKSEGNLSDAQRTKIEKQLALLVEAMSNYKNKED